MKLKSPSCSTGHGTGVLMPASLHTILQRDKMRKLLKRRMRHGGRGPSKVSPEERQRRLDAAAERHHADMLKLNTERRDRKLLWGRMKTAAQRFLSRVK